MNVAEHTIDLAGEPVFYRSAPAAAPGRTPVYLHTLPTSSDDWTAFLARTGGIAPDLPGFGRSGKGGHLEYSLASHVAFLAALLRAAGVGEDPLVLVGHGWGGAIALAFAQQQPDRVARIVLLDPVPLLAGFEWPALVRRIRRPLVGELLLGAINERALRRILARAAAGPDAFSAARSRTVWEQFDQGTQRAIVRILRSADPRTLAAAGDGLDRVTAPTLVLWGERDPWLEPRYAAASAARLPDARAELIAGAGHWPWLTRPEVIERVVGELGLGPRP